MEGPSRAFTGGSGAEGAYLMGPPFDVTQLPKGYGASQIPYAADLDDQATWFTADDVFG